MKASLSHFTHTGLLVAALFFSLVSIAWSLSAQNREELDQPVSNFSCIDIPQTMTFCGDTIDLTRFDRRERMDRELLAFTYMHSTTLQMIKRANRYFPLVESILRENNIPDDFKYLMSIESNNNPLARSVAGAAGLWQFMPVTAREFGLEVTNNIDERYHVEKATRAACRYLKQAYARFGNWVNVAASYNAGQGRIAKEIANQYEEDALDLQLVEETARYVYRILAVKMLFANPSRFGFRLRASDLYPPIPYREIKVESTIEDLPRFAKSQGTTYALLRNLNPWIRGNSLHIHGKKEYFLRIPDKEHMHYNPRVIFPHDPNWVVE